MVLRPRTLLMLAMIVPAMALAAEGEWESRAPLPEARTEVTATTDGERIFLIGGFGQGQMQPSMPRAMYAYTPDSDRWEKIGDIPAGVHHAGFAYHDGRLYIIGGYRDHAFNPTDRLHIYDLERGTWQSGAPMPTSRGSVVAVVIDDRILVVGGKTDRDTSVATLEVYDPAKDTWERRRDMFTGRDHLGAAAIGGKLYVVAGRAGNDFEMTANEVYDPATDTWQRATGLPTGRSGVGAVAHDGWIYVFGGETFGANRRTFDDVERYNPVADRWEALAPMPTARHGMGVASVGGRIYTIAGGPGAGLTFSSVNEVFIPPRQDHAR
jgi:N-acetylneuraminic acid mutarotase